MGEIFNVIFVQPILNGLVAIYQMLQFIHIPSSLGFSIMLLTILIRLLLYPLTASQLKVSKKMQDLSPHLFNIKEKHKGDNKRIQQETMRLYKEHGVNPAAGCLPVLVQIPLFYALYSVFQKAVGTNGNDGLLQINKELYFEGLKLNSAWDLHFFGIPLDMSPMQLMSSYGFLVFAIPVLTGVFQFVQSKMMIAASLDTNKNKMSVRGEKKEEDFAQMFQKQSLYLFPAMIGIFAFNFPVGLSLYWNTFTVFGILQQYRTSGLGGVAEWLKYLPVKKKK